MIVAFWSPYPGRCGLTTNMMISAYVFAEIPNKKTLVLQTDPGGMKMQDLLSGSIIAENEEYYGDNGIAALMMNLKSYKLSEDIFMDSVTPVIKDKLDILKTPGRITGMYKGAGDMLLLGHLPEIAEKYYDYVFCDIGSSLDGAAGEVLNSADVVVVNLRQDHNLLEKDIPSLLEQYNNFYMFGLYCPDSRYSIETLRFAFPGLKKRNSAVIPFCGSIFDAVTDGELFTLLSEHGRNGTGSRDSEHIRNAFMAADALYSFAH